MSDLLMTYKLRDNRGRVQRIAARSTAQAAFALVAINEHNTRRRRERRERERGRP